MTLPVGDPRIPLVESLRNLVPADEEEARDRDRIIEFVLRHPNPFDRNIKEGHLTGSAIVVSADGSQVLLLHHRKLDRWLQPGGHADQGENTGEEVAVREAREETGIEGLRLHPTAAHPFDVDIHSIPARGNEPAHEHLDLRYLVTARRGASLSPQKEELLALRWIPWSAVEAVRPDPGLRRALRKTQALTMSSDP
jgi:8-oxo-dGTP pyrophosphatase MutT (NUDIX family)